MENVQHVGSRKPINESMDDAWYITGFVDGEGCFSVSFTLRNKMRTGIEVRPSFSIGQNKRSLKVLQWIRDYFGCGAIRFSKTDQLYKYEVRSIKDLRLHIIPHFQKFPLRTSKQIDFTNFAWVCGEISASRHLSPIHLRAIVERTMLMNEAGKKRHDMQTLLKVLLRDEGIV